MNASSYTVHSPVMGTFYASPEPGADPFVTPGNRVEAGDVVCVVESMKIFPDIKTAKPGIIKKVLVDDEDMVMKNQPLVEIEIQPV